MAKTDDQKRIDALEKDLAAVDAARVALEERVEKLETLDRRPAFVERDSMGLPKVV